jgi:transcriptional regulator with XRE-family HTH domain
MESEQKQRNAAAEPLKTLRKSMGKTQQAFAVEALNIAVATVGRWESGDPPGGDMLLKLAEVADANGQHAIRDKFRELYLDDVLANLRFNITVNTDPTPHGYLIAKLEDGRQIELAQKFLRDLVEERDDSPMAQIQKALRPKGSHGK